MRGNCKRPLVRSSRSLVNLVAVFCSFFLVCFPWKFPWDFFFTELGFGSVWVLRFPSENHKKQTRLQRAPHFQPCENQNNKHVHEQYIEGNMSTKKEVDCSNVKVVGGHLSD